MNTPKPSRAQGQSHPITVVRDLRHALIGANEKAILYALASRMNRQSSAAWPSVATLAGDAGVSESTVHNVLPWLRAIGVLTNVESKKKSNTYTINFARLSSLPDDLPARTTGSRKPSKGVPEGARGVPQIELDGSMERTLMGVPGAGSGVCPVESMGVPGVPKDKEKAKPKNNYEEREPISRPLASPVEQPPPPAESTIAHDPATPTTPEIARIIATLQASPELLAAAHRGSTPDQLAGLIAAAVPGKDPVAKLRALGEWLQGKPDAQARVGAKWIIDKIIADASRLPTIAAPPPPPRVLVDFSTQPLPNPYVHRAARFN